jgi:cytochrome d ubiquinol oxidase subunit I
VILGQPDAQTQTIDNAIAIPQVLGILTYRRWNANVQGLDAFPTDQWPDAVALLFYAYHIMVGLGTVFVPAMGIPALLLWRRRLWSTPLALWLVLLATPFPFIANAAGWMTAELGRQPWIIYGVMRTADAVTPMPGLVVPFVTFTAVYLFLSVILVYLLRRQFLETHPTPTRNADAHGGVA